MSVSTRLRPNSSVDAPANTAEPIIEAFTKKTGLQVEYWRASATKAMDRALTELRDAKSRGEPYDLFVADAVRPESPGVKLASAIVTNRGGRTCHAAIIARELGIPAVVGLSTASRELRTGDYVLLDGFNGLLIVNPTDQTLFEYGQLAKIKASLDEKLREVQHQPAVTLDGTALRRAIIEADRLGRSISPR